ncbi:RING-type E3 ubiquitin transferase [Ranunculus cassubicifolius]
MDDTCAVCTGTLEWVAYGPCNHREVCSTCVSRLRFICNDHRCCICKTESDIVFITKALGDYTKTISDFSVLENNPNYWYHEETGAYFDDFDHYNGFIKPMCRLSCGVCEKNGGEGGGGKFGTIDGLKNHLFHRHKKIMCVLCLEGRKSFICEQRLYTRPQLDRHILTGDSEVDGDEMERGGFSGHPMCEFCKKRFYGETELYQHMSTQHFTCHICRRLHPEEEFRYYRSYDDLEVHFGSEHFLCEDKECLAKKFVVFASETDFKRHNILEHGGNTSRAKRNAALQSFPPLPGSSSNNLRSVQPPSQNTRSNQSLSPAISTASTSSKSRKPKSTLSTQNRMGTSPRQNTNGITGNGPSSANSRPAAVESFPPLPSISTNNMRSVEVVGQNSRSTLEDQSPSPPIPVAPTSTSRKSKNSGLSKSIMSAPQHQNTMNVSRSADSELAPTTGIASSLSNSPANHGPLSSSISASSQFKEVVTKGTKSPAIQASRPAAAMLANSSKASRNSLSFHNLAEEGSSVDSSMLDFPPIHVPKKNELPASTEPKLGDSQTASDSIWETIRTALDFDENKYTSFRELCAEFRQAVIGADEYLAHVKQFGLSHLVLDLARLFPDVQMQRDLLKTYNASLRSDSGLENGLSFSAKQSKGSNKSKGKTVEAADIGFGTTTSSNGGGSSKQQKKNLKTLKLQRVQLANPGSFSPSTSSTAKGKGLSGSLDSSVSDFPPIPAPKKIELAASTESKVDDAQTTQDSLWENIRTALEFDENKYAAFRDLSEEYKQGEINAGEYLSYIQQFGLTHLVLELSRLFPDPHMQKELLSTYNASVRSGNNAENSFSFSDARLKESNSSKKGKAKSVEKKKSKLNKLPIAPVVTTGSSSSRTTSSSQVNRYTEERREPTEDFPPIPVTKTELPQSSEPKVEDVYTANTPLVELIRSTLEFDEKKYTVFRDLTEEYGQGVIGAGEYLSYIEQFGLSHLVLDLARLCTDPWKQRELLETYNASVRSDRESNELVTSSSSSKSKAKQVKKKTPKVQRMHLGNGFEQQQSDVVPCVWGIGGGQKLATLS